MLDIKYIRENLQIVKKGLKRRNGKCADLEELIQQEEKRLQSLQKSEQLKNKKKKISEEIGKLKHQGKDAFQLMDDVKNINLSIKDLDEKVEGLENIIHTKLLGIPNIPDENIPALRDSSCILYFLRCGAESVPKKNLSLSKQAAFLNDNRSSSFLSLIHI